jgi:hypothetical protein
MDIEFSMWLATRTRWAHLTKIVAMPGIPRVGDYVKFRNDKVGDYFAFRVSQVTYREEGLVEVWTDLFENTDDRMYSFEEEHEFDEYLGSYLLEGWRCERGVGPNRRYQARGRPPQDGA